ncbi:MAG: FISUMP domain-containing protein [Mangrovibacterium sp.]
MEKKLFQKSIFKGIFPFVLSVLLLAVSFQSCQKDEILPGYDPESELNQSGLLKSAFISAEDIDAVIQRIQSYLSAGDLESGLANAFIVKLENAKKSLEKGNEEASINQVQALFNQVEGLLNAGKIDASTGEGIIFDLKVLVGENPTFTDTRDKHEYKTIKIGDQVWMAENLAFKTETGCYFYGENTPELIDHPEYEELALSILGRLYTWDAAVAACPPGWHLPTDAEWTELANFLIDNGYGYEGIGDDIAKALADTEYWYEITSGYANAPGSNAITNNSSGFSGRPGGYRYEPSPEAFEFLSISEIANWWSATGVDERANAWLLSYASGKLQNLDNIPKNTIAFSVRCIRD